MAVTTPQAIAALLVFERALEGKNRSIPEQIVAMCQALESYEAAKPSIDGPEFDGLLNEVCGAAIDAHACGNDFGTGRKRAEAEEALVAFIDARGRHP